MFDLLIIYVLSIAQVPREFSWKMVSRSRPSTPSLSRGRPALRGGGRGGGGGGRRGDRPFAGGGVGLTKRAVRAAGCRSVRRHRPPSFWPRTSCPVPAGRGSVCPLGEPWAVSRVPAGRCDMCFDLLPKTKTAARTAPRASSSGEHLALEAGNAGRVLERRRVRRGPRSPRPPAAASGNVASRARVETAAFR